MSTKTFNIIGTVKDLQTGELMPFANVVPVDANNKILTEYGTATDVNGKFTLKVPLRALPNPAMPMTPIIVPASTQFRVTFVGYNPQIIQLKPNQKEYDVRMTDSSKSLSEIKVIDEHPRTTCKKQGGIYDEVQKSCMMPPPAVTAKKKRNNKALIIGAVALVAIVVGVAVYKYAKPKTA